MGSGLSMTSVNKIKELAASREYSLALEIIDSQDLSKSLNPQFIRLCGDVYIANRRYLDARRTLIMAHRMAPEAKRVIFSLVDLYLKMGYKDLADFYYSLYMFDAEPNLPETNCVKYIYDKAQGCPFEEIETLLFPVYSDIIDYDWSFELYLLFKIQGKNDRANAIKEDYIATFKNEPNVALLDEIEQSDERLEELFYVYPREAVIDDAPSQEELRKEEAILIEADSLRMNPKEAEIQILIDDYEKASIAAKLKLKKQLKEQERQARLAEKNDESESEEQQDSSLISSDDDSAVEQISNDEAVNEEKAEVKVNIFQKLFSKKKSGDGDLEKTGEPDLVDAQLDEAQSLNDTISGEQTEKVDSVEMDSVEESMYREDYYKKFKIEPEELELFEGEVVIDEPEDDVEDDVEEDAEQEDIESTHAMETLDENSDNVEYDDVLSSELDESDEFEASYDSGEQDVEKNSMSDTGESEMQEIYGKKKISIVSEVGEDTFVNTQEFDTGNPFEELKFDGVNENENSKRSFVVEEVELQPEDETESEVDDFTDEYDFSFPDEDFEVKIDKSLEHSDDLGFEEKSEITEEVSYEAEPEVTEEISYEAEPEVMEEISYEAKPEVTEEISYEAEPEVTEEISYESEPEVTEEISYEAEPEVTEEIKYESGNYTGFNSYAGAVVSDPLNKESVYDSLKSDNRFGFPEFKSSLFPEIGPEVVEVNNNFDDIMTEAQDKFRENLLKEEQMQREAEALLASLGIDFGSVKPTIKPEDAKLGLDKRIESKPVYNSKPEVTEDLQKSVEEIISEENITEKISVYNPSRDELKSVLKIDSVKKSILKQIKEYR